MMISYSHTRPGGLWSSWATSKLSRYPPNPATMEFLSRRGYEDQKIPTHHHAARGVVNRGDSISESPCSDDDPPPAIAKSFADMWTDIPEWDWDTVETDPPMKELDWSAIEAWYRSRGIYRVFLSAPQVEIEEVEPNHFLVTVNP